MTGALKFLVNGDPKPGVEMVKKFTKIYSLGQAANLPKLTFVDMSEKPFNMVNIRLFKLIQKLARIRG